MGPGDDCDMPKTNPAIERTRDEVLEDGVILCARMDEGDAIVDACRAAVRGGLRVLEITLTTPGALEAIGALAADGDAVVGAGTVLTVEQAREVKAAGGRFVLSPVFDPAVIAEAHRLEMLAVPGTASPTEILAAYHCGARLIKVFPIGALGGPAFLRAVRRSALPDSVTIDMGDIIHDFSRNSRDPGFRGTQRGFAFLIRLVAMLDSREFS